MATPQELVLPSEKNKGSLKSSFHFFSSSVNECVSYIETKLLWCILFFTYSKIFDLFSGERTPLTLLEIKLPIVLDITSFINRQ